MTKLSPAQRALITIAAQAADGAVEPSVGAGRTLAALIKRGFLTTLSREDGPGQLTITAAGRAALGGEAAGEAAVVEAAQDSKTPSVSAPAAPANVRSDEVKPPKGKLGLVIGLLRRPEGAALTELMSATGWQAHSVRGALSGAIKKKLGLTVLSEKTVAGSVYRIPSFGADAQARREGKGARSVGRARRSRSKRGAYPDQTYPDRFGEVER